MNTKLVISEIRKIMEKICVYNQTGISVIFYAVNLLKNYSVKYRLRKRHRSRINNRTPLFLCEDLS